MIQINLLRVREQLREESARHFVITYLLSIILALAITVYVWQLQRRQYIPARKRLTELQQEKSRYIRFDRLLRDLKHQKEIIDRKRKIIQILQKDRDYMCRSLALVALLIPADRMWFDSLSDSLGVVNLRGIALSNETIAEFMRSLEESPYVVPDSVSLSHSRLKVIGGTKLREFQLGFRVLPFSEVEAKLKLTSSPAGVKEADQGPLE